MPCLFSFQLSKEVINISLKELNSYRHWNNTTSLSQFLEMTKRREKAKTVSEVTRILVSSLDTQQEHASFRVHTMKGLIRLKHQRNGGTNESVPSVMDLSRFPFIF
jgi:hypothetical protein